MGECSFAGLCFYVYQSHHLGIEATIKLHFRGGSGLLVANSFPVNWPWYRLGLTYFDRSLIRILMGGGEAAPCYFSSPMPENRFSHRHGIW